MQRVPATESSGRIHTSTATVAVLPEADEVEVEIDDRDLNIEVKRSSGPGGQSVNTTDSAVRITHIPSGLVVEIRNARRRLARRGIAGHVPKFDTGMLHISVYDFEIFRMYRAAGDHF